MDWLSWLSANKGNFAAAQSIITSLAILIGAIWGYRRFRIERPLEPALTLEICAGAFPLDANSKLLHVDTLLKNTGRAMFDLDDPNTEPKPRRTWVKIFGIKGSKFEQRNDWIDWDNSKFAVKLYEGWFKDTPYLVLESGEQERYAADLIIPSDVSIVNIWVKISETVVKDKKLGRPYYWSTQKVFDLSKPGTGNTCTGMPGTGVQC